MEESVVTSVLSATEIQFKDNLQEINNLKALKNLTIRDTQDKSGFKLIQSSRKKVKAERVNAEKKLKSVVQDIDTLKARVRVYANQTVIHPLIEIEEVLEKKESEFNALVKAEIEEKLRIEAEKREAKLLLERTRLNILFNLGCNTSKDGLKMLNGGTITYNIAEIPEELFMEVVNMVNNANTVYENARQEERAKEIEAKVERDRILNNLVGANEEQTESHTTTKPEEIEAMSPKVAFESGISVPYREGAVEIADPNERKAYETAVGLAPVEIETEGPKNELQTTSEGTSMETSKPWFLATVNEFKIELSKITKDMGIPKTDPYYAAVDWRLQEIINTLKSMK
jgi:hypothetical protein